MNVVREVGEVSYTRLRPRESRGRQPRFFVDFICDIAKAIEKYRCKKEAITSRKMTHRA